MSNLLTYNLKKLDKNKKSNTNLKRLQFIISSFNNNLKVKKFLGVSYGGEIFLIHNTDYNNTNNKKIICKKIPLTSSITKTHIHKYYKIMEKLYNGNIKQYINPILDYKIRNNNVYLLYPYYSGYNIQQLKKNLLKLDNTNFNILIKHLVKKILEGLSILHYKGIYHQNINPSNILINTNNKKLEMKIKFYDLSTNNKLSNKNTKKLNKSNRLGKNILKLRNKDCLDCGNLLLDLITFKYIKEYNSNSNSNILSRALKFLNIEKREKDITEIVDSELVDYVNIINDMMVKRQHNINKILKEILFKEKYKD